MTALAYPPHRSSRSRPSRPLLALLTAGAVALAANAWAGLRPSLPPTGQTAIGSLEQIDHSIRAWTSNLATNDRDFYAATNLGLLYEARGRLTSNVADYDRARVALDRALQIVPADLSARLLHARVLLATHDFAGALAEATPIAAADPGQLQALATVGDASLELGDIQTATASFARLASSAPSAAVTARLSRLAFVTGDPAEARRLAERAYGESHLAGESGAALGWYAALVGSTSLAVGDPGGARTWFETALAAWPAGQLPLAGMARTQVALGNPDAAVDLYRRAAEVAPQPEILAALGDLYLLRGNADQAEQQYQTVAAIGRLAAINAQVFNRQLVLFDLNHGRDVETALQLAEQELAVRQDAYGYDAYAWALLANGRPAEAAVAIQRALAGGPQDSLLEYHAGMIAVALGDLDAAWTSLGRAVSRPGALDPMAVRTASQVLEVIR